MNKYKKKKLMFFLLIVTMIFLLPVVVMFLWNSILPDVINVKEINYWQALGIFILSKILFGGFKSRGKKHHKCDKFMEMDNDEKSIFKEEWQKRME